MIITSGVIICQCTELLENDIMTILKFKWKWYSVKNGKTIGENYKWIIAVLCLLVLFVGLGFCSSAKNVYIAPITNALNFSRSAFGLNETFRYATTAIAMLFFQKLIDRFGTKKLILAGLAAYIISAILNAVANNLWMFYISGIFLGIGVAFAASAMASVIVNQWFTRNKGTILGILLSANAAGSAVAISMFTPIIYEAGNPFGYKNAYWLTALAVAVVFVITLLFYKEKTTGIEENREENKKKKRGEGWEGFDYEVLRRKPSYYAVIISLFLYALVSVSSTSAPHFTDIGFSPEFVALLLSIGSIGLAIAKVLVGIIYDHYGLKVSVNICLFSALFAKLLLLVANVSAIGKVLAISYSVLISIATPLETVMISIIALDLFGTKSFGKTLALTTALFTVGHAINSPLLNLAYDFANNYTISFVSSTIVSVLVIVVLNISIRSLKKDAEETILTR